MVRAWVIAAIVLLGVWMLSVASSDALLGCRGDTIPGWELLLLGWIGPVASQFGWYANVIFLIALPTFVFKRRSGGWSVAVGLLATGLALSSLGLEVLPNDAGGTSICGFGTGFYLWLGAIAGLALATIVKWGIGLAGSRAPDFLRP